MRRVLIAMAWLGLLSLELLLKRSYSAYGTCWHYLPHQMVGWAAGLAVAALVAALTRRRVPLVVALVGGQVASIVPDLQFRFQCMPHTASMDLWLGHISIHTGPSPTLVALAALLLAGWGWLAAAWSRRRTATALALSAVLLVAVASLLADPVPTTLEDFPTGPVSRFG